MDFGSGFRFGLPFFLPIDYYDTRIQVLDNVSIAKGDHLIKFGAEWNRVNSVQTFIGFANSRYIFASVHDFFTYLADSTTGGPLLYLQQAGIDRSVREAGTQSIPQHELAVYLQDSWKPDRRWTVDYGLRWEAQVEPSLITPKDQTYYAVYYDSTVTNARGSFAFPSDGTIPSDWKMFQPRLGVAYDPDGSGREVFRGNAGLYYARIPGLNLASSRSTDGAGGPGAPAYGKLFPDAVPASAVSTPGVFVFDKDFQNPRTFSATVGYERQIGQDLGVSLTYTHARTDHLTRFFNANDPVFNNRVSYYSAQPVSEKCGAGNVGTGQRAASPQDRICPDGSVLKRNTLRKDNAYFSWDVRVSRPIDAGRQQVELMVEVFNPTNTDNFKDPAYGGLLFNFDGTIRSGLGDPRQVQAGVRWVF